jgi:hypothetical protein
MPYDHLEPMQLQPLIKVVDFYTHKDFYKDTTRMELSFLYSGQKKKCRIEVTNETFYDMYINKGMNANDITFFFYKQLVSECVHGISEDEYVRTMATNIFLAFYAEKMNAPILGSAGKFSVGNHGSYSVGTHYKDEVVHKSTLDYMKLLGKDSKDPSVMSKRLPGMDHMERCPARDSDPQHCLMDYLYGSKATLWNLIQHLNDHHKWTREGEIADWLDKLHDDGKVDLSFNTPDN